jgi:hypothetical protein
MRALRVVGLDEGGKYVVVEDSIGGERYKIPADERLRAAARGDVTRLGQMAIELESQMRPREIQTRIRAGESVEQVASAANLPVQRVERFAYPVLLERSRTAELAQRAHPVREDGPDVQTLTDVAAHAFSLRGQDYTAVSWDSWRGDDGRWVVQLRWKTGRSDNRAHWSFSPGAHGGTVVPLDDNAFDIMDPNSTRPLRTVRPVIPMGQQSEAPAPPQVQAAPDEEPAVEEVEASAVEEPQVIEATGTEHSAPAGRALPASQPPEESKPEPKPEPKEQPEQPAAEQPAAQEPAPQEPAAQEPAAQQPAAQQPAQQQQPAAQKKGKKGRPNVPSWEDVLLGVRSNRG